MTATFSSTRLRGDVKKTITVYSNDPKHVKETLTCNVKVKVPFKTSPTVANFRNIDEQTTPLPQTVTIKRGDGGPLKLEIVEAGKAGINTLLEEIEPGEHYELIIGLSPPMNPGRLRSWVKLKTGIEEVPETTVPVYGQIPASWEEFEQLSANR